VVAHKIFNIVYYFWSIFQSVSWSIIEWAATRSNTLAKPRETSEMCFFVFSDFVMRWSTKSRLSEVDFLFLKPNWFGCISLLLVKNHQSLCDIIL